MMNSTLGGPRGSSTRRPVVSVRGVQQDPSARPWADYRRTWTADSNLATPSAHATERDQRFRSAMFHVKQFSLCTGGTRCMVRPESGQPRPKFLFKGGQE